MNLRRTGIRFKLPYTQVQAYDIIYQCVRAEINRRGREFITSADYLAHLQDVASWLVGNDASFGLFLCGSVGNGKTTLARAVLSLAEIVWSNEGFTSKEERYPQRGTIFVNAKEVIQLAKAFHNPTHDNSMEVEKFKKLRRIEILCIDDLGTESRESLHYGNVETPVMDLLSHRYEEQFCTIVTSNLSANEIEKEYDGRIADRFREMMHIVNFGNEESFRTRQA